MDRRGLPRYLTFVFSISEQASEDALSLALAAVAHGVRRDLLARVRARPARVTDLAAGFEISLPAISRHLRVLEGAGLVTRRIEGRDHYIAANADGWRSVTGWVEAESAAWNERLQTLKLMLEAEDGGA
jgi:DNA-binding transcriptional ArsR family regulator